MKTKFSILVISAFLAIVCTSTAEAWDLPLNVDVFKIKFDHGGDNSALNIRVNYSLDVSIPEFSYYAQISRPAFVRNASPSIETMFTAFPPDTGTSLTIGATSADSTWSMNTVEVFFNGSGISIGDTGYVSLSTLSGKTIPSTVGIDSVTWAWKVTKIGGTTQTPPLSVDTRYHGYYVLLDTPQAPMTEPWTAVLDYACSWASGATSSSGVVSGVTTGAYNGNFKNYRYSPSHCAPPTLYLSNLLNDTEADCGDMAGVVQVFSNAIGLAQYSVQYKKIDSNNNTFTTKQIDPIGSDMSWQSVTWGWHVIGWYNSSVYDACIRLNESSPRVPIGDDLEGSYKNDLYQSGTWNPLGSSYLTAVQ